MSTPRAILRMEFALNLRGCGGMSERSIRATVPNVAQAARAQKQREELVIPILISKLDEHVF